MNDDNLRLGVTTHLSASAEQLSPAVLARLGAARQQALAQLDAPVASGVRGLAVSRHRAVWSMAVMVLGVFVIGQYWGAQTQVDQFAAVDAALLSDDLPIEAYLDPEFSAWLRQKQDS